MPFGYITKRVNTGKANLGGAKNNIRFYYVAFEQCVGYPNGNV